MPGRLGRTTRLPPRCSRPSQSILMARGGVLTRCRTSAYRRTCCLVCRCRPWGRAWAVGYYVSGHFLQQSLIEHFDGNVWSVVPSPSPGALQNILFGVTAISDADVWAVGAQQDSNGLWHTLAEHWDGSVWAVVNAVDAGASGNHFYAVKAVS